MGYQEKRTWILLATQLFAYGAYFWALHHGHIRLQNTLWIVISLVLLQIVLQSALAATTASQKRDERDVSIERRAYRAGYLVLMFAVIALLGVVAHGLQGPLPLAGFVVNTLLFLLGLAEVAKLTAQVSLYRRLA